MEKQMERENRQLRAAITEFTTREDGDAPIIEGYFAVFNSDYVIDAGMSESIAPGAFTTSLNGDVRALTNHDSTLVLGRTTAATVTLRQDEIGLWARIAVNPKDSDAVNAYERVKRGDVSQCSIGFDIVKQDTEVREDGSVHWTIREAKLWEVSMCTFPAYEETNISARAKERDEIKRRSLEAWKTRTLKKLKGEKADGTESAHAQKKD